MDNTKFLGGRGLFGDRVFYARLFHLALPIMAQQFLIFSLNMVDTLMIGALGENEIAAVGAANQFFFLFNMLVFGVTAGASIFISQYWGAKNRRDIRRVLGVCLSSLLIAGVVFTLAALFAARRIVGVFSDAPLVLSLGEDYLGIVCFSYIPTILSMLYSHAQRSVDNAVLPMKISFLAILVNTFFNYLLIFGKLGLPALGVKGAAIATVIARVLECVLMVGLSLRRGQPLAGGRQDYLDFDWPYVKNVCRTVLPVVANEVLWGLGAIFYTAAYGRIGTAALAASNITNTVQNVFMVLCFSISSAALVMIGHQIGGGETASARAYAHRFIILTALSGLLLGGLIIGSADFVLSFFRISAETARAAREILVVFGLSYVVRQVNLVLIVGIFRGGGDAKAGMYIDLVSMWLVGVPLALAGAILWQLTPGQLAVLITAEEVVKFVVAVWRLKSGRWIHDLSLGHL